MRNTRNVFYVLIVVLLLFAIMAGCGAKQEVVPDGSETVAEIPEKLPEKIPEELPEETVMQEEVVPEEPEDAEETDDIIARLTDGYWENMIQARKVYKFYEDGTVEEYDIEPLAPVKETNLHLWETLSYFVEGNTVWLKGDGWDAELEWVTKADPIDWDIGLHLPEEGEFLYEVDWVHSEFPFDNAMYLEKSEMPDPDAPNAGYEDLIYQLYTDYELGVDSHMYYDMDQDGIEELIVHLDHRAGEVGREYHFYTTINGAPEFVGSINAYNSFLLVPDFDFGLYRFTTSPYALYLDQIMIWENAIVEKSVYHEEGDTAMMDYTPPGTYIEWENYYD